MGGGEKDGKYWHDIWGVGAILAEMLLDFRSSAVLKTDLTDPNGKTNVRAATMYGHHAWLPTQPDRRQKRFKYAVKSHVQEYCPTLHPHGVLDAESRSVAAFLAGVAKIMLKPMDVYGDVKPSMPVPTARKLQNLFVAATMAIEKQNFGKLNFLLKIFANQWKADTKPQRPMF